MKLTDAHDNGVDALARKTPAGMFFWAGTGPKGKTCRECSFVVLNGRYAGNGGVHGAPFELKPVQCRKAVQHGIQKKAFRHSMACCKYFAQNERPPKVVDVPKF